MPAEAKRGFPIFLLISASCYAQEAKAILEITNLLLRTKFPRFGDGIGIRYKVGNILSS